MRRVLLMTATVNPDPNVGGLAVRDGSVRRAEYEEALRYYVHNHADAIDGVVFAENSGADLASFGALVPESLPFEALAVPRHEAGPTTGRGYLETMLVVDAFAASNLLKDSIGIKVTGRYRALNLSRVVSSLDLTADLSFNSRTLPERWVDMWLYSASAAGARALARRAHLLHEGPMGRPSERSMWAVLDEIEASGMRVERRLKAEPRFSGVRGWDGASYDGLRQRSKWLAREIAKKVAPRLWI